METKVELTRSTRRGTWTESPPPAPAPAPSTAINHPCRRHTKNAISENYNLNFHYKFPEATTYYVIAPKRISFFRPSNRKSIGFGRSRAWRSCALALSIQQLIAFEQLFIFFGVDASYNKCMSRSSSSSNAPPPAPPRRSSSAICTIFSFLLFLIRFVRSLVV